MTDTPPDGNLTEDHLRVLVRDSMEVRGMTVNKLAKATGITHPAVGDWVHGRRSLTFWRILRILAVCEIQMEAIATLCVAEINYD